MSTNEETNFTINETPTPSTFTPHITASSTDPNKKCEVVSKVRKQRELSQSTSVVWDHFIKFVNKKDMYPPTQASMMFSLVTQTMDELFRCYRNMLQPSARDVGESGQECLTSMGQGTSGGCNDNVVSTLIGKDIERTKKRLDRFKKHQLNTGSKELKNELEKYLSEPVDDEGFDDDEFNVLMWWKLNQFRFPILAALARDVLVVPVSTVDSKSAFSIGGCVLDAYRSSLTPKVVQALICAQDWLRGKARGDLDLIKDDLDELDKLDFVDYYCVGDNS